VKQRRDEGFKLDLYNLGLGKAVPAIDFPQLFPLGGSMTCTNLLLESFYVGNEKFSCQTCTRYEEEDAFLLPPPPFRLR
jgi:hypothetical protein